MSILLTMKKKSLKILILILLPFIVVILYFLSIYLSPFGKSCNGSLPPQYHYSCEVNVFGVKVNNPILKCSFLGQEVKSGTSAKCFFF